MKQRIVAIIAIALAASIAFTACGNSSEPSSKSVSSESEKAGEESSSPLPVETSEEPIAEEDEGADSADISLYAAEMQKMLDALSGIYGDAIKIEASTEGNNALVITYTLLDDSLGLTAENIAESMEAEGSKMEDLASQMESGGIASPVIIVKWIDTDGSELFKQEYK